MYSFLQKPAFIGEKVVGGRDTVRMQRIVLKGSDDCVERVANQRLGDSTCTQLPQNTVPASYKVEVTYYIDECGYISIRSVYVSFDDRRSWSCFYDIDHERTGVRKVGSKGNFHFYFLDENGLENITNFLVRHHKQEALKRLTKQGPSGIPEPEEDPESLSLLEKMCAMEDVEDEE